MPNVDELISKIIKASQSYYSGEAIIDDKEFDSTVEELRKLNPNHPILNTIGWGYKPVDGEKYKHPYIMGSLGKIKIDDLQPKFSKYQIATPKIDGASISVYYEKGWLKRIVSRGNGEIGIDVTPNLIHAVPMHIESTAKSFIVRGEAALTIEDWAIVGGKSPRNSANGLVQSKFASLNTKFLMLIAYSIPWSDTPMSISKKQQLKLLSHWGFNTVPYIITSSKNDLTNNFTGKIELSNGKHLLIDGMVLSADITTMTELENGYFFENDSIAIKFHEDIGESTIRKIEWTSTRTGRVVPVAVIDPINLSGATINRIACYNAKFVEESKIGPGAIIKLVRANEVIPKIVEVLNQVSVSIPNICPACGTRLTRTKTGIDLICNNQDCSTKMDEIFVKILALTQPDGVGTVNIDQFIEELKRDAPYKNLGGYLEFLRHTINISSTTTFITKMQNKYGKCMGISMSKMLSDAFDFKPTISQLVKCANIPMVGDTACDGLNAIPVSNFIVEVYPKKEWQIYLPNITSKENFIKYYSRISLLLKFFNFQLTDTSKVETIKKIKVAVTGKLSVSRDEWYSNHKKLESGSVSAGTKYLVTNEPSGSAKYKAATKLGIPIITESEFDKLYGGL